MVRRIVAILMVAGAVSVSAGAGAGAVKVPKVKAPSLSVSPSKFLVNGQTVTLKGSGYGKSKHGSLVTWDASECVSKASKVANLYPGFSKYCSLPLLLPLHVSPSGSFTAKFKVATGRIGESVCGTPGHQTCVIEVGSAEGRHSNAATISFRVSQETS
jgi:hypothetical protein